MVTKKKKFGDEVFRLHSKHERCADARKLADKLRKKGHKARVVKIKDFVGWGRKPYEKQWNRCAIYASQARFKRRRG